MKTFAISGYKLDVNQTVKDLLEGLRLCDTSEVLTKIETGEFRVNDVVWKNPNARLTRKDVPNGSIVSLNDEKVQIVIWEDEAWM